MIYKIVILVSVIYVIGNIIINPYSTQWTLADRLYELIKVYGPPTTIDRYSGGLAIWTKETLKERYSYLSRIVIKDESIEHLEPTPHIDNVYITIDYTIPDEKIHEIMGLSDSIMYDKLKKQIIVRCCNYGIYKAILVLAMRIADNRSSLKHIEENGLYKKFITRTMENKDFEKILEDEIEQKLKWNV